VIDHETKYKIQNPKQDKTKSKYMNVTEIFDSRTQQAIKDVESFFKEVIKDKLYWRRDILTFFGIENEDMKVFLNYHQSYKQAIARKMQKEMN
jgi:hypothetical protein